MRRSAWLKSKIGVILLPALFVAITGCGGGIGTDGAVSSGGTTTGGTTTGGTTSGGTTVIGTTVITQSDSIDWAPTTTNTDGTPIGSDLAGYKVYYGNSSGSYSDYVTVSSATTEVVISQLPSGTYYFAVTSFDTAGNESVSSNEAVKTL
jgi:hypothetical protein